MRVLLTGAHGFIGGFIATALREAGHSVIAAVRSPRGAHEIACDFAHDVDPAVWLPRLAHIDAVVNCAGILCETATQKFAAVHVDAPVALFRACVQARVRKVVQLSALGEPEDGEFIASKHRADATLATLDLDWTVLRPGLVYSASGAYGGTALLRALAALPLFFLPQQGAQKLRPIAAEDVGLAVVAALDAGGAAREIVQLVGPQALSFGDYLRAWRAWFGLKPAFELHMPRVLVNATVACGEALTAGPVCRVIANLLQRERVGAADAGVRMTTQLALVPRSLDAALAQRPSTPSDLRDAQLYTSMPALRIAFALLWIASGLLGLGLSAATLQAMVPDWPPAFAQWLGRATGVLDLLLGLSLLFGVQVRRVERLMLAMVLAYTAGIGLFAPQHWLDPFGGLLKNLVLIAALWLLLALEPRE
ncbi:MAG: SDR family oxidoreductase [Gammaproteobacteria bacterium]|nr:MAG: SDR family oxidoreductase [Gammaproteobacteria bacterium]